MTGCQRTAASQATSRLMIKQGDVCLAWGSEQAFFPGHLPRSQIQAMLSQISQDHVGLRVDDLAEDTSEARPDKVCALGSQTVEHLLSECLGLTRLRHKILPRLDRIKVQAA